MAQHSSSQTAIARLDGRLLNTIVFRAGVLIFAPSHSGTKHLTGFDMYSDGRVVQRRLEALSADIDAEEHQDSRQAVENGPHLGGEIIALRRELTFKER